MLPGDREGEALIPPRVDKVGQCRRRAPFAEHGHAEWPEVVDDDWCGEWQARAADPTSGRDAGRYVVGDGKAEMFRPFADKPIIRSPLDHTGFPPGEEPPK